MLKIGDPKFHWSLSTKKLYIPEVYITYRLIDKNISQDGPGFLGKYLLGILKICQSPADHQPHLRLLFEPTARGPARANITGRPKFSTFPDTECMGSIYLPFALFLCFFWQIFDAWRIWDSTTIKNTPKNTIHTAAVSRGSLGNKWSKMCVSFSYNVFCVWKIDLCISVSLLMKRWVLVKVLALMIAIPPFQLWISCACDVFFGTETRWLQPCQTKFPNNWHLTGYFEPVEVVHVRFSAAFHRNRRKRSGLSHMGWLLFPHLSLLTTNWKHTQLQRIWTLN